MHRPTFRPQAFRLALPFALLGLIVAACGSVVTVTPALPTVPVVTMTHAPTATASPTETPTPTATPSPTPDPVAHLQAVKANELGWILVLEYHLIEEPEGRWSRTPANFRADVERLIAEGYYPINLADLAQGRIDVPAGKSPVVITFDDSSSGQFRYLSDGTIDPNSAAAILVEEAQRNPGGWRPRATFFILLDVDVPDRVVFGQPEFAEQKLQQLVTWGMEIGSHTVTHFRLDRGTPDEIRWELASAETRIEALVPGYEVSSLSVPLGMYPEDETLLYAGDSEGMHYDFVAAVEVVGGASPSPFSLNFNPYHIRRIQAIQEELDSWLGYMEEHPELRYVSDGDPNTVAFPDPLPERLQGILRQPLPDGKVAISYPAEP